VSDSYTKLFSSITESTIWGEPAGTRLVWITMLAKCNRNGEVYGAVPGIARLANVTMDECEQAIETLLAPDKWSRTPDFDGRRIIPIDGGWRILNHAKFDRLRSAIETEERDRERKREWDRQHRPSGHSRAKQSDDSPTKSDSSPSKSVPPPAPTVTKSKSVKTAPSAPVEITLPHWIDPKAWAGFVDMRKRERHPLTQRAAELVLKKLEHFLADGDKPNESLDQSTRNGWRDVYSTRRGGNHATSRQGRNLSAVERVQQAIDDRDDEQRHAIAGKAVPIDT
jgi:hypothetical protein